MAGFKSDRDGFLVGRPVSEDAAARVLRAIKGDTGQILSALRGRPASVARSAAQADGRAVSQPSYRAEMAASPAYSRATVSPRPRDSLGRFVSVNAMASSAAEAAHSMARTLEKQRVDAKADARMRGDDGRFGRGNGVSAGVAAGFGGAISGAEQIDPLVGAANEVRSAYSAVKDVVTPLGRAFGFSPAVDDQVGLLRRMWRTLRDIRKDGQVASNSALSRLRGIKPAGASGGSFGLLGAALPMLLRMFSGGAGALGMIKGFAGAAGGALGGLLKGGGKALLSVGKRLPLIGNLISLVAGLGRDADIGSDDSLTDGQKRSARWSNAAGVGGSVIGTAIGGLIGSLAGPIGTVVGAIIGGWLGGEGGAMLGEPFMKVYDYISSIDIAGSVSRAWDGLVDRVYSIFEPAKAAIDAFVRRVSSLPGAEIVTNAANAVREAVVNTARNIKDSAVSAAGKTWSDLKSGAARAVGWMSEKYESGGRGAATVSTGKGDAGGASYGTHQLSSKRGALQSFLSSSGYGQQFAGMKPGTPEFTAKWEQVAESDPSFAGAQHDFIKRTHFEPQMDALKKSGIDLSGRGEAVREAVWSTSVQFGGPSDLIRKALAGKDVSSLTNQQIVSAIQDYKIANNETLFRSSSEAVRKGTLSRAVSEKGALLATAAKEPAAVPVARAIAKAPAMPRPAIAAPAPQPEPQASRVNSSRAPAPQAQVMPAGQDVADRTIAHIVTGGIGAPAIGR